MYATRAPRGASARRAAFTLIELLCVVSIITLLISILLPSFAGAREQAKKALCMNHQKQLATANQYYAMDYKGLLPDYDLWLWEGSAINAFVGDGKAHAPEAGTLFGAKQLLGKRKGKLIGKNYAVTAEIYKCPSDRGERRNPVIAPLQPPTFSYTRNKFLMDVMYLSGELPGWKNTKAPYCLAVDDVARPSQTPLMLEEHETSALNDGYCFPLALDGTGAGEQDYLSMRHADRAVLSYFDLHVDAVRSKEVNMEVVDAICWSPARARVLAPGLPRPTLPPAN